MLAVGGPVERFRDPDGRGTYRRTVTFDGTRAELERLRSAVADEVNGLEADLHAVFEASQDSNADDGLSWRWRRWGKFLGQLVVGKIRQKRGRTAAQAPARQRAAAGSGATP